MNKRQRKKWIKKADIGSCNHCDVDVDMMDGYEEYSCKLTDCESYCKLCFDDDCKCFYISPWKKKSIHRSIKFEKKVKIERNFLNVNFVDLF